MQKITNFLMFEGKAEEAMNFYMSLFAGSKMERVIKYGPGQAGPAGTVMHAVFTLNGQQFMCIDSPAPHGFTFTPAISLYVACDTEDEAEKLFSALAEGGQVLMAMASYTFSNKYGWVNDRFGVSWQLSFNK